MQIGALSKRSASRRQEQADEALLPAECCLVAHHIQGTNLTCTMNWNASMAFELLFTTAKMYTSDCRM